MSAEPTLTVPPMPTKQVNAKELLHFESVPFNPRFPNQNQTKHCWTAFVEYQKCIRVQPNKEEDEVCKKLSAIYKPLCPKDWTSRWNEQIEQGRFPGQHIWAGVEKHH